MFGANAIYDAAERFRGFLLLTDVAYSLQAASRLGAIYMTFRDAAAGARVFPEFQYAMRVCLFL